MPILDLSGAVYPRFIGGFPFNAYTTFEEAHSDSCVITEHPVDTGASMSDHIFIRPPEVRCKLGWSNSDPGAGTPDYVLRVYAALLQLKNARQLFQLYTGKRLYNNMFTGELQGPITDYRHEFSISINVVFKQLLLVNLASATAAPTANNAAANPNPGGTANPPANQPTQIGGTVQTQNAPGPSAAPEGLAADQIPITPAPTTAPGEPPVGPTSNSSAGGVSSADYLDFANASATAF